MSNTTEKDKELVKEIEEFLDTTAEKHKELMKEFDEFRARLQDPMTKDGFWNAFNALWGTAQSQPGFDHQRWLAVKEYIQNLEEKLATWNETHP